MKHIEIERLLESNNISMTITGSTLDQEVKWVCKKCHYEVKFSVNDITQVSLNNMIALIESFKSHCK